MNRHDESSGMSRRQFLVKAGMITGAVATFPLRAHSGFLFNGRPPLSVGLVLPDSSLYPLLGENLLAGIQLAFDEAGWKGTSLLVERSDGSSAGAAAARLLGEKRVDLLAGMINPLMMGSLRTELEKAGTVYINMEGGANSFQPREESPLIFHNSLGYWQANFGLGRWAASTVGKRCFVTASIYESGYDSFYAFPSGFEQSGGRIVGREITLKQGKDGLDKILTAIRSARPDFVYASFSGSEAVDFVRSYAGSGLSTQIPLITSGFTVDDPLLKEMGKSALGIKSALSWAPTIDLPQNRTFCTSFTARNGYEPDQFALLGYDTGMLIVGAVKGTDGGAVRGESLKNALEQIVMVTPRGELRIDNKSGNIDTPIYLREVRRDGNRLSNAVIGQLSGLVKTSIMADVSSMTAMSGWTNSYLCS